MLPFTRNRTYGAGEHVARGDILLAEDVQIAQYQRGFTAGRTLVMSAAEASSSGWGLAASGAYRQAGGADVAFWPLRLPAGRRISSVFVEVYTLVINSMTWGLFRWPIDPGPSDTVTPVVTATGPGVPGSYQTLTATIAYPYHTIEAGYGYSLILVAGQINDRVVGVAVDFDQP